MSRLLPGQSLHPPPHRWYVYYQADVGVVISASHNPFEYNGIKFFNRDGFKLDDEIEDEIEDILKLAGEEVKDEE